MVKLLHNVCSLGQNCLPLVVFFTPFAVSLAAVCGTGPAFAILASNFLLLASFGSATARKAAFLLALIALCSTPLG